MFPLAQQFVDSALLVSDEVIVQAQHALWKNLRIVVEPGGATALAAVLSGAFETKPGQRIGIVLCGANTDAVRLSKAES
jgi:threonine dehydratase